MKQFKVGDRVVRVGSTEWCYGSFMAVGKEYTVDGCYKSSIYLEGIGGCYSAEAFELAKQPTFKSMKFKVESPEQSKEIQEALFSMGYVWTNYGAEIMWLNDESTTYLHTDAKGSLYRCDRDPDCFEVHQEYTIKTTKSYELIPVEIPKEEEIVSSDTIELMGQKYSKKELEDALRSLKPVV